MAEHKDLVVYRGDAVVESTPVPTSRIEFGGGSSNLARRAAQQMADRTALNEFEGRAREYLSTQVAAPAIRNVYAAAAAQTDIGFAELNDIVHSRERSEQMEQDVHEMVGRFAGLMQMSLERLAVATSQAIEGSATRPLMPAVSWPAIEPAKGLRGLLGHD